MTHIVDEGRDLLHAAGQKVQDGVNAVQKREPSGSGLSSHAVELVASVAGAVAAFFVSRLVRSQLGRHGK